MFAIVLQLFEIYIRTNRYEQIGRANKHKNRFKPTSVMTQNTTTCRRRNQCTVSQQFRWFKKFETALDFLRKHNTGTCPKTGKTFGELIEHFVRGEDETNLMATMMGI